MTNEQNEKLHIKPTFSSRFVLNKLVENQELMFEQEDYEVNDTLFDPIIAEIKFCLLLDLFQASITLTNHLLEKSLKYFLIDTEVGEVKLSANIEDINIVWKNACEKYNGKNLKSTIDLAFEHGIITIQEKDELHYLRKIIRNGFSHGDPSKIFNGLTIPVALFSIDNPKNIQRTEANIEIIPFIQGIAQAKFAETHAEKYFHFVFAIIHRNCTNTAIARNIK